MNAVDAVEGGKGKIRITHRREGGRDRILIQDNGMGMTPEELDRCMDPFYTTKDAGEGSGLGLPVAASILQNHGGRLQIQSEKGRGTTVTLDLPAGGVAAEGAPGPAIHN
jgi:signal transduction histidine kinase